MPGHPEADGVAFLVGQAVRAVRAQVPLPFEAVGAAAAVQPDEGAGVRAQPEPPQVLLHQQPGLQPQHLRQDDVVGPLQSVAVHVVVDLAVGGDVRPQPLPRPVESLLAGHAVAASVMVAQQVGHLVHPDAGQFLQGRRGDVHRRDVAPPVPVDGHRGHVAGRDGVQGEQGGGEVGAGADGQQPGGEQFVEVERAGAAVRGGCVVIGWAPSSPGPGPGRRAGTATGRG